MNADRIKRLANLYCAGVAAAPAGLSSGHLYANVAMVQGDTLDEHNMAVVALKKAELVREEHHLLTWAGPEDLRQQLAAALEA
jgi:hypothetical protein